MKDKEGEILMNRDTIVKYIGKVEEINYSESGKCPRLRIKPVGSSIQKYADGFIIMNNDLMKAIRRTLATGDIIECTVDNYYRLLGFRVINKTESELGVVRHLSIHYEDVDFEQFRKEGSKSDEIGNFYGDVVELGETVYRLDWTGMYSGVMLIVRLGNSYFSDLEQGPVLGPFSTLIDAIKGSELDYFSEATESIECTELDSKTLASLLKTDERIESGFKLFLNSEEWELNEDGTLKKIHS